MKLKEFKQAMDWRRRVGFNGGGYVKKRVLPKKKPEEEVKKRKLENFEKAKPALENPKEVKEMIDKPKRGLVDEPGSYAGESNKGSAKEIRKYLNKLKPGVTVDVAAYLDKHGVTERNTRSGAINNFKRILPEYKNKNFNFVFQTSAEAQRQGLSKEFKKVAKAKFADEIAEFDSIEDWAYSKENKTIRSEINRGIKTKGKKGITMDTVIKPKDRIKVNFNPNKTKVTNVTFPSKEMEKKFIEKVKLHYKTPQGQGYLLKDFANDFPISKSIAEKAISTYYKPKLKLKYPKGKTVDMAGTKFQAQKTGEASVPTVEEKIRTEKKKVSQDLGLTRPTKSAQGTTVQRSTIDFAHRISKDHAKALGLKFGTETTGFDSRLINQVIIRPVENQLENLYAKQRSLLKKFKEGKAPKDYVKQMNDLNTQINKQVKLTNGRLIGVNIDPNTQEVSFTGQKKKFKLSNLNLTFQQVKDLPQAERQKIITDSVLKGVEAEKARGFRPYDFRTLLSSPERRKAVLKYAKTYAPDIFPKVKQAISNPTSKQRFALYSFFGAPNVKEATAAFGKAGQLAKGVAKAEGAFFPAIIGGGSMYGLPFKRSLYEATYGFAGDSKSDVLKRFQPQASTFLNFNDAQQKYNTLLNNYNNASPYDKLRFKDKMAEKTKEFENLQTQYQSLPLPERIRSEAAAGKAETQYKDLLKANRERRFQYGVIPKKELFMDIGDYFGNIGKSIRENLQPTENILGTTIPMGTIPGQTQYEFAGGGIAKLAGKPSGPPPESGPTPQGLDFLMKRGR
jgi:hypothetical protein